MMKRLFCIFFFLLGMFCLSRAAMAEDLTTNRLNPLKAAFIVNYADLLHAEYEDSLELAQQMRTNISVFIKNPTGEGLDSVRQAWIKCRDPYHQSEVGRFYDGPIEGVEGFINAWPIDENYLDYTKDAPNTGIINLVAAYPRITRDVLVGANEREGEKTISTGFHAIEFLLWGQDLYVDGPGRRSYLDYVDSSEGPGLHADRRREYLRLLSELLVQQLQLVTRQWATNQPNNYRSRFLALPPDAALTKILSGVANLSNSELSGERILVPYTTKSQENEHSCFSDTTHLDILRNEIGIQNICLGRYKRINGALIQGTGLIALVETVDAKLALDLRQQLETGVSALKAIPPPFDQAILGNDASPGRIAIKKALEALEAQNTSLWQAASALRIRINLK